MRHKIKQLLSVLLLLLPCVVFAASYGPVKSNDHLYRIALNNKPVTVSVQQAMVAIYRANPQAFQGNMNHLLLGSTLTIPSQQQMQKISKAQAIQIIEQQNHSKAVKPRKMALVKPYHKPPSKYVKGKTASVSGVVVSTGDFGTLAISQQALVSKPITTTELSTLTKTKLAQERKANASIYDGFYVGAGLGGAALESSNNNVGHPKMGASSLFAGYGHVFSNHIYLGEELGANLYFDNDSLHDAGTSNGGQNQELRGFDPQFGFYARIKPGYLITPKLLAYTSFGADVMQLKYQGQSVNATTGNSSGNTEYHAIYGMDAGLGLDYHLWSWLTLGAEYQFAYYPKQTYRENDIGDEFNSQFGMFILQARVAYHF